MRIVDPRYPMISNVNVVTADLPNNAVIVSEDDVNHPEFNRKEFELLLVQTRDGYPAVPVATATVGGADRATYKQVIDQFTQHASHLKINPKSFDEDDHEIYTVSHDDLDRDDDFDDYDDEDDDEPYLLEDEDDLEEDPEQD